MEAEILWALGTASSFIVMVYIYVTWRREHTAERKEWLTVLGNQHQETLDTSKETNTVLKNLTVVVEKLSIKK